MKFTIGTDPEYLLTDGVKVVSAIDKIAGTKEHPAETSFGMMHVDNVAAEINVFPAKTFEEFDTNVKNGLIGLEEIVSTIGLSVSHESVAEFSDEDLKHPVANRAGCDPDISAYTKAWNPIPALRDTKYRCVGGHIHLGVDQLAPDDLVKLVKTLDLLITVPTLSVDNPIRRKLYGGAGAFRPKPYGFEYRTPSNNWTFNRSTREWVYAQVERAISEFKSIVLPTNLEAIINGHKLEDARLAREIYGIEAYPVL